MNKRLSMSVWTLKSVCRRGGDVHTVETPPPLYIHAETKNVHKNALKSACRRLCSVV